jgi:Leucine rich repeat
MHLEISKLDGNNFEVNRLSFKDSGKLDVVYSGKPSEYSKAETVLIKSLELYKFPRGIQSIFPVVKELTIIQCKIEKISREDFAGFCKLKKLNLEGNRIEELQGDVFNDLRGLKELNLSRNSLKLIDVNLFDTLPYLKSMSLANISSMNNTWIQFDSTRREEMIREIYKHCKPPTFAAAIIGQESIKALEACIASLEVRITSLEGEIKSMKTLLQSSKK